MQKSRTRRRILELASAAAGSLLFAACGKREMPHDTGILDNCVKALRDVVTDESDSIRDAANLFADTVIARKRCFFYDAQSQYSAFITDPTALLPPLFIPLRSKEMAETLSPEDTLMCLTMDSVSRHAIENGIKTVWIGEASDNNGSAVAIPPHIQGHDTFSFEPPVLLSIISAIAAECYHRSGGIGLTDLSKPSLAMQVLNTVADSIEQIIESGDSLNSAAALISECIDMGGHVYATGNGSFIESALQTATLPDFLEYRPQSSIGTDNITPGDCVIYSSASSNAAADMLTVSKIKKWTSHLISISPHESDSGFRLHKNAEIAIDNHSRDRDGLIGFDNGQSRYISTSLILNAALILTLAEKASKTKNS